MMHDQQYKELWEIRFRKVLNLEKESSAFYTRLLKRNQLILEDAQIRFFLKQIMEDRGKRAKIAQDLVHIVQAREVNQEEPL
ncbi:MAG: hypothetical protein HY584_05815 [Candidatus Omnitrophica bacterium]|nr:hypothetical protein [Candidatus Omnitrophota bacterium]